MEHHLGTDPTSGEERRLIVLDARNAASLGAAFAAISPWADYPYPASALAAYFKKSEAGAPRYQIVFGGQIAGVAGLRDDWLRGPYLQFLGILPGFQGRGLGACVLAWFERTARDGGQRNLWVAASDFNTAAIRFYQRHGFAACASLDGLVADGRTEILLRKKLS